MTNFIDNMKDDSPYSIFFISDFAITVDFGNIIDEEINKKIIAVFNYLRQHPLEGMIDIIPCYSSFSIVFDIGHLRKKIAAKKNIHEFISNEVQSTMRLDMPGIQGEKDPVRIPVCYADEFALDLAWISGEKNISTAEIVRIHTSTKYRVFMLGFLPGFAYMGKVEESIEVPRKMQPQLIPAGSVGIAGRQTGIYPLHSPGGWRIVGRTPWKMFDRNRPEPCLLNGGDYVEFYSITKDEFEDYQTRGI